MQLSKEQYDELLDRVSQAQNDPEIEFECNFGMYEPTPEGFQRVVAAFGAMRGAEKQPPEVRLDVTPWGSRSPRLSVVGKQAVLEACMSDVLSRGTEAISKADVVGSGPMRLTNYGILFNSRRESAIEDTESVAKTLSTMDKQFRHKQRLSFLVGAFRLDCTVVYMNNVAARSVASSKLLASPRRYEIEIEMVGREGEPGGLVKALLSLVTVVYTNLEGSPYVLGNAAKAAVIASYLDLVAPLLPPQRDRPNPSMAIKDPRSYFVGPNLVALTWENVLPPAEGRTSVLEGYTVTDKADGERHLLLVAPDGKCYVINNRFHVRYTGVELGADMAGTLLDGELIERFKLQKGKASPITVAAFMIFDVYFFSQDNVSGLPLMSDKKASRLGHVQEFVKAVGSPSSHVQLHAKAFRSGSGAEMFKAIQEVLDADKPYLTDGLVFTPEASAVGSAFAGEAPRLLGRWNAALKWKPPEQNTVDFLVRMTGDVVLEGGATARHAKLLVGSSQKAALSPLAVLSSAAASPGKPQGPEVYSESEFADTLLPLTDGKPLCGSGEQITQDVVVEFSHAGGSWVPLRIRYDKTQVYQRTRSIAGAANDRLVAMRVWQSIVSPVTEQMVRGVEVPRYEDDTAELYYRRDVERARFALRPMNNFHTLWVKGETLFRSLSKLGVVSLLDMGCGRGGDLSRYAQAGFKLVVGLDNNEENLLNAADGAYARLQALRGSRPDMQGRQVVFAVWDATVPLSGGQGGGGIRSEELRDITKAVFGLVDKSQIRQGLAPYYNAIRTRFDVVSAQFMIHYCFASEETLGRFLDNVASVLADGGLFVGTHMDGERVNDLLSKAHEGMARGEKGGKLIWSLQKRYEEYSGEPSENFGKQIDVFIESINKVMPEYLVDFNLLSRELGARGLQPASKETLSAMGVRRASGMFSDLFSELQAARHAGRVRGIPALEAAAEEMSEDEKRFSFLNRYFIFQKRAAA